ncbi:MAG TPA: hypothetical protein VH142_27260 [Polyangiaceae bacterium]|jgi:hypothetical protein|nr:hypothetical protein [Polyangiaceae bacterium]
MARFRFFARCSALGVGALATACLPGDTRPVPGSLDVSVVASAALATRAHSFVTTDGWTVSYSRFLIGIGNASFDGDSCADYYDADYDRLLNLLVPDSQKLGLLYGLGQCDFGFRVSAPSATSVLGAGVTEADRALLGAPGTDAYSTNRGTDLYVSGTATNGAATKTFTWSFRQRVSYSQCVGPPRLAVGKIDALPADAAREGDGGLPGARGFDLKGHAALATELTVHGEALFLDRADPVRGVLRFDPIAQADDGFGNHDGDVALAELGQEPLPAAETNANGDYTEPGDGGIATWKTLEDFVYLGLVPIVVRFEDGGTCETRGRR